MFWPFVLHEKGHYLHISSGPGMYGQEIIYGNLWAKPGKGKYVYDGIEMSMVDATYTSTRRPHCELLICTFKLARSVT